MYTFRFIEASITTRIQNPMNWEKLKCILDNHFNLHLWPIKCARDIADTLNYLANFILTRFRSSTPKPSESIAHKMFYCCQTSSMGCPPPPQQITPPDKRLYYDFTQNLNILSLGYELLVIKFFSLVRSIWLKKKPLKTVVVTY